MDDIHAFRRKLDSRRPAQWDRLPDFPLYMDQVLSYMERQFIHLDEGDVLTASMVNNYTKNGVVPRAEGKKYSREHLAYLTFVCILKQVMPVRDMDLLLRTELGGRRTVEDGYQAFWNSLNNALTAAARELEGRPVPADLADAAVHFGLLSYAAGLVSRQYVAQLRASCDLPPRKNAGKKPGKRIPKHGKETGGDA